MSCIKLPLPLTRALLSLLKSQYFFSLLFFDIYSFFYTFLFKLQSHRKWIFVNVNERKAYTFVYINIKQNSLVNIFGCLYCYINEEVEERLYCCPLNFLCYSDWEGCPFVYVCARVLSMIIIQSPTHRIFIHSNFVFFVVIIPRNFQK